VRAALRKGLRTRCNQRCVSARLLAYRILGVNLDADVKEATLDRVVLASGVNDTAQAAVPAALCSASGIGYRLKLQDGDQEMERPLDLNAAAASIVGEQEHKIVYGPDLHKRRRALCKTILRMCMRASSGIVPRAAPEEGLSQDADFFCYNLYREFSWSNAALVLYTS